MPLDKYVVPQHAQQLFTGTGTGLEHVRDSGIRDFLHIISQIPFFDMSKMAPNGFWVDIHGLVFMLDAKNYIHYLLPAVKAGYGASVLTYEGLHFIWNNEGIQGFHGHQGVRDPKWAVYDDSQTYATSGRGHLVDYQSWQTFTNYSNRWSFQANPGNPDDSTEADMLNSYDIQEAQMTIERQLGQPWGGIPAGPATTLIDFTF